MTLGNDLPIRDEEDDPQLWGCETYEPDPDMAYDDEECKRIWADLGTAYAKQQRQREEAMLNAIKSRRRPR